MNLKRYIIILLWLLPGIVPAQNKLPAFNGSEISKLMVSGVMREVSRKSNTPAKKSGTKFLGSPYYNEYWIAGELNLKDSANARKGLLRYNSFHQRMEYTNRKDTFHISNPAMVDYIRIGKNRFEFLLYTDRSAGGKFLSGAYFEVLVDGERCRLLVKHGKHLKESSFATYYMGGGGTGKTRYITTRNLYLYFIQKGSLKNIRLRKGSIFRALKGKRTVLRRYINQNNLNLSQFSDLKKLIEYYNKL